MTIPSWFGPWGSPGYSWIVVHLVFVFQLTATVLSVAKCWYLKVWIWCLQLLLKSFISKPVFLDASLLRPTLIKGKLGWCADGGYFCVFWEIFEICPLKWRCSTNPQRSRLGHRDTSSLQGVAHTYLLRRQEIIGSPEPKFKATMGNIVRPPSQTKQSPTEETSCLLSNCCYIQMCVCNIQGYLISNCVLLLERDSRGTV